MTNFTTETKYFIPYEIHYKVKAILAAIHKKEDEDNKKAANANAEDDDDDDDDGDSDDTDGYFDGDDDSKKDENEPHVLSFWHAPFTASGAQFVVDFLTHHPGAVGTVEFLQCRFGERGDTSSNRNNSSSSSAAAALKILKEYFLSEQGKKITVIAQILDRGFVESSGFPIMADFADYLHFGECPLADDGFAFIVDVLLTSKTAPTKLKVLDVQRIKMTGKSLPQVTRLLEGCKKSLTTLTLYWNRGLFNGKDNDKQQETKRLCEVLAENDVLETLDMDDVAAKPETAHLIFETFSNPKKNTTLRSLYFDQEVEALDNANRLVLVDYLPKMRHMKELVFPLIHEPDHAWGRAESDAYDHSQQQIVIVPEEVRLETNRKVVASLTQNPSITIVRARYETPGRFEHAHIQHVLTRNERLDHVTNDLLTLPPAKVPAGLWQHLLYYTLQSTVDKRLHREKKVTDQEEDAKNKRRPGFDNNATAIFMILRNATMTVDDGSSSLLVLEGLAAARAHKERVKDVEKEQRQKREKRKLQRQRKRDKQRFGWAKS